LERRIDEEIAPLVLRDGVEEPIYFRVTDLKQWFYCPRIVYFQFLMPDLRPKTYSMEEGALKHAELRRRRRRWRGLPEGEYRWDVALRSDELHASGLVDLVIDTVDELIPVDFKDSLKASAHFKMQLVAYGIMLEEMGKRVERGFVYLLPRRRAEEVRLTARMKSKVRRAFGEMLKSVLGEEMPPPPKSQAQCVACEFRRFCGDRF